MARSTKATLKSVQERLAANKLTADQRKKFHQGLKREYDVPARIAEAAADYDRMLKEGGLRRPTGRKRNPRTRAG
jgi:hypothetical protein